MAIVLEVTMNINPLFWSQMKELPSSEQLALGLGPFLTNS
jgi:hypothetical protein